MSDLPQLYYILLETHPHLLQLGQLSSEITSPGRQHQPLFWKVVVDTFEEFYIDNKLLS